MQLLPDVFGESCLNPSVTRWGADGAEGGGQCGNAPAAPALSVLLCPLQALVQTELHLISQVILSHSASLWPTAWASSRSLKTPLSERGLRVRGQAGAHSGRGLSQASPSNVKAIKATSSVCSGRASGSGAAATTHLTSAPTAPAWPLCGCAPGWTFSSGVGAKPVPTVHLAGADSSHPWEAACDPHSLQGSFL
jgi:hypothetical protein